MSLKVIVVGAGIAGLCASIALRQAGHQVEVRRCSTNLRYLCPCSSLVVLGYCVSIARSVFDYVLDFRKVQVCQ